MKQLKNISGINLTRRILKNRSQPVTVCCHIKETHKKSYHRRKIFPEYGQQADSSAYKKQ
jgi:hypothetical protein